MKKSNKIKIDLYNDERTKRVSGWRMLVLNLYPRIKNKYDVNLIEFDRKYKKLPFNRYINYLINYTNQIKKLKGTDSVAFLPHQELAYLYYFFKFKKSVIICHDVTPIFYPSSIINKLFLHACLKVINNADLIVTDSNSTKLDLIKHFSIPKDKIKTIYLGVSENFRPKKVDKKKLLQKYNIPINYFYLLYVGSEAKQKNFESLLRVYSRLEKKHKMFLIKIGSPGDSRSRTKNLKIIQDLKIQRYKFIDTISEDDLINFYNTADLLIYPSLYEGFGLPPLEAMACGCPVITSNRASLPEIVGNAGMYVNPIDEKSIFDAVEKVVNDKKYRLSLSKKGLKQASKFTWERTANEFIKAINSI